MTNNRPSYNRSFIPAISSVITSIVTPDVIRALTPIVLATIGGGTAVLVIFNPGKIPPENLAPGMTFAGTAITAAAALAQPGKDSTSDKKTSSPESGSSSVER